MDFAFAVSVLSTLNMGSWKKHSISYRNKYPIIGTTSNSMLSGNRNDLPQASFPFHVISIITPPLAPVS